MEAAVAFSRALAGRQVMVVEDNRVNQLVLMSLLRKLGVRAVLAEHGKQAVELWRTSPELFALILMDCEMPVMDGFIATRMIRQHEEHIGTEARVPIVAVTAHVMDENRRRCLQHGMDDLLPKPVRAEQISQVISDWVMPTHSRPVPGNVEQPRLA